MDIVETFVLLPMVLISSVFVVKSEFELWDKPVLCLCSSGILGGGRTGRAFIKDLA